MKTAVSVPDELNVSQIVVVDKAQLEEHVGRLPRRTLVLVLDGIDVVLGR